LYESKNSPEPEAAEDMRVVTPSPDRARPSTEACVKSSTLHHSAYSAALREKLKAERYDRELWIGVA
jgi:hypothetical protein